MPIVPISLQNYLVKLICLPVCVVLYELHKVNVSHIMTDFQHVSKLQTIEYKCYAKDQFNGHIIPCIS